MPVKLQRPRTTELADPGGDSVKQSQDNNGSLHPFGLPPGSSLQIAEHLVKMIPIQSANPALRQAILDEGIIVYEQNWKNQS